LAELRETQVSTIEELRRMIGALRPVYLEDLGFLPALEMLVRSADERGPAQVRLEHGDPARRPVQRWSWRLTASRRRR
jgi:signal transduction histidine kinase